MQSTRYNSPYSYEIKVRKKVQRMIRHKEEKMSEEQRRLLREIEEAYLEMATTLNHFQYALEPELIEYYTYQYKAAQIKHDYLLRRIKKLYYEEAR